MREIKFRGKLLDNGEWVYGDYHHRAGGVHCIIDMQPDFQGKVEYVIIQVDAETVGQFTGLHDKNGKEIYEGDIVLNKEIGGYGMEYVGVVRYYEEDCRFGIDTTATNKISKRILFSVGERSINDGYCTIKYTNEYEILGNVYDNPELLKTE